jgi:hypothetical protein
MTVNDDLDAKVIALDRKRSKNTKASWFDGCILGETGKPLAVLANALIALRSVLPDLFAYDEMACAAILMKTLSKDEPECQRMMRWTAPTLRHRSAIG